MNQARLMKLKEYNTNPIVPIGNPSYSNNYHHHEPTINTSNTLNPTVLQQMNKQQNSHKRNDNHETQSVYSVAQSQAGYDSDTASHISKTTTTTKMSGMSYMTQDEYLAKRYRREVEKQKRALFGQTERKPKFETSYNQMVQQSRHQQKVQERAKIEAELKQKCKEKTALERKYQELHGPLQQTRKLSKNRDENIMAANQTWRNFRSPQSASKNRQQNNCNDPFVRKNMEQTSNVLCNDQKEQKEISPKRSVERAKFSSHADWRSTITNEVRSNQFVNQKVDTFKKRQTQLTSNVFDMRDYSSYIPISKKFVDMDNYYDQKRMNDPMYSDLFDQCINTGGHKPSPLRKKDFEITLASQDWKHQDLQQKMKKDYSNYNPKEQMINEKFKSNVPFVQIDLTIK